jgi:putative GTP pyrophosphokinase
MAKLDELYYERNEVYRRAIRQVEECINDIVKDFAADKLFRVDRVTSRLKTLNSLKWKAYEKGLSPNEEVFEKIMDISGARVVVNNITDISKVIEKIKESDKLKYDESSYEDRITEPDESGYRGVQFVVFANVEHKGNTYHVPCEIQVRTLFQDGWAILSHQDIYKTAGDIPPIISKLARRLADQLAVMDAMAQDIREELAREVVPSILESDRLPVTKRAVALVCYELFGKKPSELDLQIATKGLAELGIPTVEEWRKHLPSDEIQAKLDKLNKKHFGGLAASNVDKLIWGTRVMLFGDRAYREFVDKTKKEWSEIVTIARREILSELPETLGGLKDDIRHGNLRVGFYAALKELGGVRECDLCGTDIFAPDAATEVLLDHYETEEDSELDELIAEFYACGASGDIECEDVDHAGLCTHCAHLLYDKNT